jgi:hypothetical protein
MATYNVVCVTTLHPHRHITQVGVGNDPSQAAEVWSVENVRQMIWEGHHFRTYSPSTGKYAEVRRDDCKYAGCTYKTIRSTADAVADNNLDNLRACRVAA